MASPLLSQNKGKITCESLLSESTWCLPSENVPGAGANFVYFCFGPITWNLFRVLFTVDYPGAVKCLEGVKRIFRFEFRQTVSCQKQEILLIRWRYLTKKRPHSGMNTNMKFLLGWGYTCNVQFPIKLTPFFSGKLPKNASYPVIKIPSVSFCQLVFICCNISMFAWNVSFKFRFGWVNEVLWETQHGPATQHMFFEIFSVTFHCLVPWNNVILMEDSRAIHLLSGTPL